jgi:hypothetical protein
MRRCDEEGIFVIFVCRQKFRWLRCESVWPYLNDWKGVGNEPNAVATGTESFPNREVSSDVFKAG